VLGTASYISPEQAVGESATAASDRYALAVVAYELLTGTRPFDAQHFAAQARAHVEDPPPLASDRDPELPRAVDGVLDRGLAKDPAERWPTASKMVDELERALGASTAAAAAAPATMPTRKVPAPPPAGPPPASAAAAPDGGGGGHRRTGALLAGLAGLALVAVLGFVLLSGGDGGRSDGDGQQAADQPRQERRQESTPTPSPEPTREATPEPTPEATPEPTPEPTAEATAEPTAAEPDLERASELQLAGYNARQAGDYEQALESSQAALEACGDVQQESPCGYALFEVGAALNALGRPEEAIPLLEQRLAVYGNNQEVRAELKDARANARGKEKGDD